ncbi:MAG: CheB methylesterase [Pedosphaera sp.]|nr:CheB methylesterase [Pedosphaera sp.]
MASKKEIVKVKIGKTDKRSYSGNGKLNSRNGHDVIVVGASAGGIEAFGKLLKDLPADLPAAILMVIHTSPQSPYVLPKILNRAGTLKVLERLNDGHPLRPGHVYVAPPDVHLLTERGQVRLISGPKENRHRPAIDPLFRSAAYEYGERVIGVLLTGNLDDGTSGLMAIKERGGIVVVQDPKDALYPDMPRNFLEQQKADYCLPLSEIGPLLAKLVKERGKKGKAKPVSKRLEIENGIAKLKPTNLDQMEVLGKPSSLTCPECDGGLWEIKEGKKLRFRCREGHAYSGESLIEGQSESVETALWAAVRALEERVTILQRLASQARERKHSHTEAIFEQKRRELEPAAKTIRAMLGKIPR